MIVPALSIRQPWAWMIANGIKDIENRNWNTKYRGKFLIHASKTFDIEGYMDLWNLPGRKFTMPIYSDCLKGGIIGSAEIVDVVTESESIWFEGKYGLVIRNPKILPFIPIPGKLGFFKVNIPEEDL